MRRCAASAEASARIRESLVQSYRAELHDKGRRPPAAGEAPAAAGQDGGGLRGPRGGTERPLSASRLRQEAAVSGGGAVVGQRISTPPSQQSKAGLGGVVVNGASPASSAPTSPNGPASDSSSDEAGPLVRQQQPSNRKAWLSAEGGVLFCAGGDGGCVVGAAGTAAARL